LSYSDISGAKRRPALVVAAPEGLDPVLCLITSQARGDGFDVPINQGDFTMGGLRGNSNVRACHLFTLDNSVIDYRAGTLKDNKVKEVTARIVEMLTA
jgi:mRNA interferase MazF